jgi:hypothetical protein
MKSAVESSKTQALEKPNRGARLKSAKSVHSWLWYKDNGEVVRRHSDHRLVQESLAKEAIEMSEYVLPSWTWCSNPRREAGRFEVAAGIP